MSGIFFYAGERRPRPIWGPPGPFFAWAGKIQKMPKFCLFSLVDQKCVVHLPLFGPLYQSRCKGHLSADVNRWKLFQLDSTSTLLNALQNHTITFQIMETFSVTNIQKSDSNWIVKALLESGGVWKWSWAIGLRPVLIWAPTEPYGPTSDQVSYFFAKKSQIPKNLNFS